MSRIGRKPIDIPAGVTVNVDNNNLVTVTGKLGTLSQVVDKIITVKVEENHGEFSFSVENIQIYCYPVYLPGGPMVENLPADTGFHPWSRKTPHVAEQQSLIHNNQARVSKQEKSLQ